MILIGTTGLLCGCLVVYEEGPSSTWKTDLLFDRVRRLQALLALHRPTGRGLSWSLQGRHNAIEHGRWCIVRDEPVSSTWKIAKCV